MKILAPAKINLSLNVVQKRKDNYHELDMINATINLYDTLKIKLTKDGNVRIYCKNKALVNNNLIAKAIEEFRKVCPFSNGVEVKLIKRIPIGAGLGGGSSDAAATILALDRLLKTNLSSELLNIIAKNVGADVPYLLNKKISRVTGIGEVIQEIDTKIDFKVLLIKPSCSINTKECFSQLNYKELNHPQISKVEEMLIKRKYQQLSFFIGNSLTESAIKLEPSIKEIQFELKMKGFAGVVMSGSGSSILAFLPANNNFKETYHYFKKKGYFVKIVEIN